MYPTGTRPTLIMQRIQTQVHNTKPYFWPSILLIIRHNYEFVLIILETACENVPKPQQLGHNECGCNNFPR